MFEMHSNASLQIMNRLAFALASQLVTSIATGVAAAIAMTPAIARGIR